MVRPLDSTATDKYRADGLMRNWGMASFAPKAERRPQDKEEGKIPQAEWLDRIGAENATAPSAAFPLTSPLQYSRGAKPGF